MKNVAFWYMAPCGSSRNYRFGENYNSHLQCENNRQTRNMFLDRCLFHLEEASDTFLENSVFFSGAIRLHIPENVLHSIQRV
jgi:hypothetical protein